MVKIGPNGWTSCEKVWLIIIDSQTTANSNTNNTRDRMITIFVILNQWCMDTNTLHISIYHEIIASVSVLLKQFGIITCDELCSHTHIKHTCKRTQENSSNVSRIMLWWSSVIHTDPQSKACWIPANRTSQALLENIPAQKPRFGWYSERPNFWSGLDLLR